MFSWSLSIRSSCTNVLWGEASQLSALQRHVQRSCESLSRGTASPRRVHGPSLVFGFQVSRTQCREGAPDGGIEDHGSSWRHTRSRGKVQWYSPRRAPRRPTDGPERPINREVTRDDRDVASYAIRGYSYRKLRLDGNRSSIQAWSSKVAPTRERSSSHGYSPWRWVRSARVRKVAAGSRSATSAHRTARADGTRRSWCAARGFFLPLREL